MCLVHPIELLAKNVLRYVTVACGVLVCLTACADKAQEASAEGAVAEQQLEAGDFRGAKASITKAIALRDDIIDLQLLRGRIALAQGSSGEAFDAYSDALSLDPSNNEALQGVSQLGLSTGHLEESLQATDRLLILTPNQPNALLTRGIHALVRHRFDEAITYADKILALGPANENASILKARALFLKDQPEAALEAIGAQSGLAESPGVALTKLELFRELRRPNDMKIEFARLRQLRPDDLTLRLDEANLRFKLGDRTNAHALVAEVLANPKVTEQTVNDAIRLWVNYGAQDLPSAQLSRIRAGGTSFSRQGVTRFLIDAGLLRQADTIAPSLAGDERESLTARLLAARGDYMQALAAAKGVLARDKTQCDSLVADSAANLALQRWTAALETGQRAAAECPDQVAAWLVSARAYDGLGQSTGSERIYSQALAANQQDLRLVRSYSEWLVRQKRTREAVAIARRLTRDAPALTAGWQYYAELCERTRSDCGQEAGQGLADAQTRFGIDLPTGTQAPNSLFGRFVRR